MKNAFSQKKCSRFIRVGLDMRDHRKHSVEHMVFLAGLIITSQAATPLFLQQFMHAIPINVGR